MLRILSIEAPDADAAYPYFAELLRKQSQPMPTIELISGEALQPFASASMPAVRFERADEYGIALPASVKEHVTVIDHKHKVLIDIRPSKEMKWKDADAFARESRLGKSDAWKLDDIDHLFTVADRTRRSPACDPYFFPHIKPSFYWSSTPVPELSDYAFGVYFGNGAAYGDDRYVTGFVLPVRAWSAPASQ